MTGNVALTISRWVFVVINNPYYSSWPQVLHPVKIVLNISLHDWSQGMVAEEMAAVNISRADRNLGLCW